MDPVTGYPLNWGNWTKHSCVPYQGCTKTAEITVDNTRYVDGQYSARVTLGQVPIGFASLWHRFPSNTYFYNLTDMAGDIDVWFWLEPRYAGMGDFVIKIYAQNGQELDYVFDPDPRLSYPNQTFPLEPTRPYVKSFLLGDLTGTNPQYRPGEWHRFNFRNLKGDWQVPMRITNGSGTFFLPGFSLNEPLALLELGAFAFQSSGSYYSIIVWLDDVKVLLDPPTYSLMFNFTDLYNNDIDDVVKWRIFNQTGHEITGYRLGDVTLKAGTYTVEVHYPAISTAPPEKFRILRRTVPLDTPTVIRLPMMKESTGLHDYIAFNNTITSGSITFQDSEKISFTASGASGAYKVLVKVPAKPDEILRADSQTELVENTDWTYDTEFSLVSMTLQSLGNFTLYLVPRPRLPTISFIDRIGLDASAFVVMRILNSQNNPVTYVPGSIPPDENFPYSLEAAYLGNVIYRNTLDLTTTSTTVTLQMLRINNDPSYIAVNSTVTSITVTEHSTSRLRFTIDGSGSSSIIVKVPKRPLYVERNGVRMASWTYEGSTETTVIDTDSLGTFSIVFETTRQENSLNPVLYIPLGLGLATLVTLAAMVVRRRSRPSV